MENPWPLPETLFTDVMFAPLARLTIWSILIVPALALEATRTDTAPEFLPVTLADVAVYNPRLSIPVEPKVVRKLFLKFCI